MRGLSCKQNADAQCTVASEPAKRAQLTVQKQTKGRECHLPTKHAQFASSQPNFNKERARSWCQPAKTRERSMIYLPSSLLLEPYISHNILALHMSCADTLPPTHRVRGWDRAPCAPDPQHGSLHHRRHQCLCPNQTGL